ncbi:hypothetical protein F5B20DRAFT_597500 [Whalleya microplaca]|nr:hypothetical protein F5B20DRAFT_597500 [Whalleya microplaca]
MKGLSLATLMLSFASSALANKTEADADAQLYSSTWKASMYLNDGTCQGNGNYFTFDGTTSGFSDCQNLGANGVAGVKCSYFSNDGRDGPFPCSGKGDTAARGIKSLNAACSVYEQADCEGTPVLLLNTGGKWQCRQDNVKSFQCRAP